MMNEKRMRRKIIIALDSFKGSLSSKEAGQAAARGVRQALPGHQVKVIPVADGGEGTAEALAAATGGRMVSVLAPDPLGRIVNVSYGLSDSFAAIDVAAASGLTLVKPEERNPEITDSFGTGILIKDAIERGYRNFIIGLGGSATNDAGVGMLRALGYRFLDCNGREVRGGGGSCLRIWRIDSAEVDPRLGECSFTVASDVRNILLGNEGASRIFAPQKGADEAMVTRLDKSLTSFSLIAKEFLGHDYSSSPGAGAAGGLGFAFIAFLGATLRSGVDLILDTVGFDDALRDASLVITGEGRLDLTTLMGKTPEGILRRATRCGIPVIGIGGSVSPEAVDTLLEAGFRSIFPIVPGVISLEEAMNPKNAVANIERTVAQILRTAAI